MKQETLTAEDKVSDLLPKVQATCGYTDEQMAEVTKGGKNLRVKKLVQFAVISYLFRAGLIDRVAPGTYQICAPLVHKENKGAALAIESLLSLPAKDFETKVKELIKARETKEE